MPRRSTPRRGASVACHTWPLCCCACVLTMPSPPVESRRAPVVLTSSPAYFAGCGEGRIGQPAQAGVLQKGCGAANEAGAQSGQVRTARFVARRTSPNVACGAATCAPAIARVGLTAGVTSGGVQHDLVKRSVNRLAVRLGPTPRLADPSPRGEVPLAAGRPRRRSRRRSCTDAPRVAGGARRSRSATRSRSAMCCWAAIWLSCGFIASPRSK